MRSLAPRIAFLVVALASYDSRTAHAQTKSLGSALIPVAGTASNVRLTQRRDADVTLTYKSGGVLTARMESVRNASDSQLTNAVGNRIELEIAINGAAPIVLVYPFDFVEGRFKVIASLGLAENDVVAIRRIDFFDASNNRFATLGVRIL